MFNVFENYLRNWSEFSDSELQLIRAAGKETKVPKWQSILHEGEICRINCFITIGCFRLYRFSQDGTDHTLRFGIENWWITDQESYNNEKPSDYNIETLASNTIIVGQNHSGKNYCKL